jgi:MMP 1-O-methyltransferase
MIDWNKFKNDLEMLIMARRLDSVPGFLDLAEGFALMTLAQDQGDGEVVEIGSYKGKSTCWLAYGCRRRGNGHVTAVDHFRGSPEHQAGGVDETAEIVAGLGTRQSFDASLAHFAFTDIVTVRQTDSADTSGWRAPIRLLFIDGDHSYEATKRDLEAWRPFVVDGGVICFHDYMQPHAHLQGVTQFIDREILPSHALMLRVQTLVAFRF